MTTLQAKATRDRCAAIRKEAWEKYEHMDRCLDGGDWMIAFGYMTEGDNLMALAARQEERQRNMLPEIDFDTLLTISERQRLESLIKLSERELLNRAAGLS